MIRTALAAALLVACGGDEVDPCAGIAGTCVAVEVVSSTVERVDQLELDVLYGDRHGTTTTAPGDGPARLPLVTAIEITLPGDAPLAVGVVAAGKLAGNVLGTGAASSTVARDEQARITIELATPVDCVAGGLYCGGDKLAGDASTLYQCNAGGVPLARGVCTAGCIVRPTDDDTCRADGGTCVEGGFYCGGDKLDGDPQTLYRCSGGVGVSPRVCPDGCIVSPPGSDDRCR